MKLKINFKVLTIIIFLINGCVNTSNLQLKTKSETQELSYLSKVTSTLQLDDTPPDFTVVTTEGKVVRLSDFAKKQQPVIVYFFATWCPWCARDYESLSEVYKDYGNKVSILSISLDLSEDLITLKEYKKKYPELKNTMFAPGQNEILVNYRVTRTTTKYAIDRNGDIIYAGFGAFSEEQWRILLEALAKSDETKSVESLSVKSEKASEITK